MFRMMKAGLVVAAAVAIVACGSTSFQSTWSAPDAGPLKIEEGTKVVAFFPTSNTAQRRGLETALANELNEHGLDATAAYQIVPEDLELGTGKAKPYLERAGTEFVLMMQITGSEQQITGTPSMWGGGFYGPGWGGWGGWGWGGGTDIRTDTLVGVETLLFDLKADKLVWAGQSQTMNPSKAESFARELVRAVGNELQKDGLVGPAK
jgi:hypothetical protein